tara:strand:+ start:3417 stop:3737 length:321 start_codon:yes stop_codon:yes gene_type:complete
VTVTNQPAASSRSTRGIAALLLTNAILLVALLTTLAAPSVQAQLSGRSSFLMVAGEGERSSTNFVWILESRNGELVLVDWTTGGQGMKAISHRNVQQDIEKILRTR